MATRVIEGERRLSAAAGRGGWITAGLMLAVLMVSVDSTIVNVSLPHMQASLSASPEQITWTLSSFIVAMGMATPLSGWLATRFGVKATLLGSVMLFTAISLLCGTATNLPEMVALRALQGATGAPLVPLAQTVLLNINPPERYGRAMALFAIAGVASPIIGPVLGALLTDQLSWRWCFYVNLPVGAGALAVLWLAMPDEEGERRPFDFLGFGALALAVGAFQLMLDRGTSQDWFASPEIWAEASLAACAFWVFVTHSMTAAKPLFAPELARDRNFVAATMISFFMMMLFFSSLALLPLMMQNVLGYSVVLAGLLSMPRGLLMLVVLQISGRLDAIIDRRILLAFALAALALAFWLMGQFDIDMTPRTILTASLWQGVGQGMVTVPLTTLAMATIRPQLRADASALNNIARSLGGAVGLAVMQATLVWNTQRMHAALAGHIRPDDPVLRAALPHAMSPDGLVALNAEVSRQALMVAYVDGFRLMALVAVCMAPLLLFLRQPRRAPTSPPPVDIH